MVDTTCFCGARFATFADLEKHANDRGHRIRCDCNQLFKTPEDVFNHQVDAHKERRAWKLHPSFVAPVLLPSTDAAVSPDQLVCNVCHQNFKNKEALGAHTADKHTILPGKLICNFCDRDFKNDEALRAHNTAKHSAQLRKDKCSLCNKSFKDNEALQDHHIDKHAGISAKFFCNFCNSSNFMDDQALQAHKADAHPSCPVCSESLVDPMRLAVHKKGTGHCFCDEHDTFFRTLKEFKVHNGDGKHVTGFECLDCERSFGTQQGLDDHLKTEAYAGSVVAALARANEIQNAATAATMAAAREEANLRCEECKRNFKKIADFKQHKASLKHHKLSDLKCPLSDQCNKTFSSPSSLLFHLESGKCKSGMSRKKLNAMVCIHDTHHHITHQKNRVSVLSAASAAGALPSATDDAAVRSALSSSGLASMLTPEVSSVSSESGSIIQEIPDLASEMSFLSLTGRNGAILTPNASTPEIITETDDRDGDMLTPGASDLSDYGSERTTGRLGVRIEELEEDDGIASSISYFGGVPIYTPTQSGAPSVTGSTAGGVPIYTPTHSRGSSVVGGVHISSTSSQAGEWTMINNYKANPLDTYIAGSSSETMKYDSKAKNWPCTFSGCEKSFRRKKDLLAHRESPAHAPELYHCPTGLEAFGATKKMKSFKTLSGFAQHIEAGACAGGKEALKHIAGLFEAQIAKATGKQVKLLTASAVSS